MLSALHDIAHDLNLGTGEMGALADEDTVALSGCLAAPRDIEEAFSVQYPRDEQLEVLGGELGPRGCCA